MAQAATAPSSNNDQALYAIGVLLARNLRAFALTPADVARVQAGLADEAGGKATVDLDKATPLIQALEKERQPLALARQEQLGKAYAEAVAPMVWSAAGRPDFVGDVQAMRRRVEELVDSRIGSTKA